MMFSERPMSFISWLPQLASFFRFLCGFQHIQQRPLVNSWYPPPHIHSIRLLFLNCPPANQTTPSCSTARLFSPRGNPCYQVLVPSPLSSSSLLHPYDSLSPLLFPRASIALGDCRDVKGFRMEHKKSSSIVGIVPIRTLVGRLPICHPLTAFPVWRA